VPLLAGELLRNKALLADDGTAGISGKQCPLAVPRKQWHTASSALPESSAALRRLTYADLLAIVADTLVFEQDNSILQYPQASCEQFNLSVSGRSF
jgi:hypothetical protein